MSWYHYILGFIGFVVVANILAFFSDLRGLFEEIRQLKYKNQSLQLQLDYYNNQDVLKKYAKYYGFHSFKMHDDKDGIWFYKETTPTEFFISIDPIISKVEEAEKLKKNICCKK